MALVGVAKFIFSTLVSNSYDTQRIKIRDTTSH